MAQEKVRVYILARELNMESKDLLDLCRQNGIDIKNQLSSLEPEQRDQIEQLVKRGTAATAVKTAAPVLPSSQRQMRQLDSRPKPVPAPVAPPVQAPAELPPAPVPVVEVPPAPVVAAPPAPAPVPAPAAAKLPPVAAPKPAEVPTLPSKPKAAPPPAVAPPDKPAEVAPPRIAAHTAPPAPVKLPAPATPPAAPPLSTAPPSETKVPTPVTPAPVVKTTPPPATTPPAATPTTPTPPAAAPPTPAPPPVQPRPQLPAAANLPSMRTLGSGPRTGGGEGGPRRPGPGSGPRIVSRTPTPGGNKPKPPPKEVKKGDSGVKTPLQKFTPEMLAKMREGRGHISVQEVMRPQPTAETTVVEETEDDKKGGDKKKTAARPAKDGVAGRDSRQRERNERAKERKRRQTVVAAPVGARPEDVVQIATEDERRRGRRPGSKMRPRLKQPVAKPKGKTVIEVPITVRALSEALGIKSGELLFKLLAQGVTPPPTINTTLDAQTAELLALEYGQELDIKKVLDTEEQFLRELDKPDAPEALQPRAPIVTVMGHVDHGKTSLLDRIRKSNVVDTEAGGITQVIRAWRVDHGGKPVTFLDTPGHEAFTKMRARGAHVTDIAVIVVAAEDGVMPQTEEAISHAKAAGVSLVVAINKVDLPNANVARTRQQLYGLEVLPDNMGGDTPFVETSAATGKGIDELLDQMSLVAELKELKANPNRPAKGVCLETNLDPGEGVLATVLVQNGTLHRGDIIVCGATFGRVRAMYDDLGRPITEAGPSVPVRITGLDEVPEADDPFMAVTDLAVARTIALKRKAKKLEATHTARRPPLSLDQLTEAKIAELKVILKADFRGSVEAIKKELEKLHHEEVRVRVLETAIGAITENDVWLALTSPQDTLIVGFNVVPDDRARALAEERGVKILQYDIIYNLTKDLRAALEGKLKPREEVVHLGRALIRETFKVSRVGTIAGCYVTQGTIKRSGKIRLIREGVVIYPPTDKTAGLDSLKRFKEDASEVREGFECGIKISGYDDVKVGDVIEAYRVDEVKRTL